MKQEDKELLLKDLSARLPYGVKVLNTTYKNHDIQTILGVVEDKIIMVEEYNSVRGDDFEYSSMTHYTGRIESVKPYLRSMEDMTDEEKELVYSPTGYWNNPVALIDMFNSHHLDYRSMIVKGLAIRVTPDNNPYE